MVAQGMLFLALLEMLLSLRIVFQFATRTALARDWRVVNVPNDESHAINFIDVYLKIILSSGTMWVDVGAPQCSGRVTSGNT